jgi:hypothetical protein
VQALVDASKDAAEERLLSAMDRLRSDVLATFHPCVSFSASTGARRRERVHLVGYAPSPVLLLCQCRLAV